MTDYFEQPIVMTGQAATSLSIAQKWTIHPSIVHANLSKLVTSHLDAERAYQAPGVMLIAAFHGGIVTISAYAPGKDNLYLMLPKAKFYQGFGGMIRGGRYKVRQEVMDGQAVMVVQRRMN